MSRILLVEDQAICREPLGKLLNYEGFEVTTAANGVEALKTLESTEVDLILLDLILPKMSGVAFLETIRCEPQWKDLPVIALTGSLDSTQIQRAQALNVCEVLTKMRFSFDELMTLIRTHLRQKPVPFRALPPDFVQPAGL